MIGQINIRPLKQEDFDAVVSIDEKVFKRSRPEYYMSKFKRALENKSHLITSLVAEVEGTVAGFIMGELFVGEYGIPDSEATLDSIGIHPDHQHQGIGRMLMGEFIGHLRKAGVEKVNTLVDWNDFKLIHFFSAAGFSPSKTINLELYV